MRRKRLEAARAGELVGEATAEAERAQELLQTSKRRAAVRAAAPVRWQAANGSSTHQTRPLARCRC